MFLLDGVKLSMKDKIVALIKSIHETFKARRTNMGTIPPHKPMIALLEIDEKVLEDAQGLIEQLDETQGTFAASSFFYLMEKIVPILRNWRTRLNKIPESHFEVSGHIKAKKEYTEMKASVFKLISELNALAQPSLMVETDQSNESGGAIVKAYDKEKYLHSHAVQEVKPKSSFECRLQ